MKLIVCSRTSTNNTEPVFVTQMFEAGLEVFHLNKPRYSAKRYKHYLEAIPEKYHNRIVIHQHHQLASKFDLLGIYYSRRRKKKKKSWWRFLRNTALNVTNPKLKKMRSFSKLSSLYEETNPFEYVFLRPVFDSLSRGNFQSAFSEKGIKAALEATDYRVIAYGGINLEKLEKVKALGFDGIAVKGGLWREPDPLKEFRSIQLKVEELNAENKQEIQEEMPVE